MEQEKESGKRRFDLESFLEKWLGPIAIAIAALVFVALAFPQFTGQRVAVTGLPVVDEEDVLVTDYVFVSGEDALFYLDALFDNGGNWLALWLYLLPILALVCIVSAVFCGKYRSSLAISSAMLSLVGAVLFLVSPTLFAYGECWGAIGADIGSAGENYVAALGAGFGGGVIALVALLFVSSLVSFSYSAGQTSLSLADITEIAIFSAVGIGLQFINIKIGATGGSINLGLIPLCLIALRHGPVKGFIASGFVYGLITCLTDGYGFQTYPFDYLIGFGSVAVLGFFSKRVFSGEKGYNRIGFLYIFIGVFLATCIRLIGSTISSMVIYGYNLLGALTYNAVYIPVTGLVTLIALYIFYVPMAKLNKIFPIKSR